MTEINLPKVECGIFSGLDATNGVLSFYLLMLLLSAKKQAIK